VSCTLVVPWLRTADIIHSHKDKTWALKSWQNFFPTTWRMKMRVKGGGRMELWSRYFHQMLALLDLKIF
jgi:hypothetical protein